MCISLGQLSRVLAALSEISEDALLDVHLHLQVRCRKSCTLQGDTDMASCKPDLRVITENQVGRNKSDEAGEYSLSLGVIHVSHVITRIDDQES